MENNYIIDTWNGEGYSDSGIIDIVDTIEDAREIARKEFKERYLQMIDPSFGDSSYGVSFYDDQYMYDDEYSKDSGAITILTGSFYGIYIHPNVNECVGMDEDEYNEMLKFMRENAQESIELESFNEELEMQGNAGLHTNQGYFIIYKL